MQIPDASSRDPSEGDGPLSEPRSDDAEESRLAYWRAASPAEHARVMCELSDRALEAAKLKGQQPKFKYLPRLGKLISRKDGIGLERGTEKHVGD
jgi:hypothetical protein